MNAKNFRIGNLVHKMKLNIESGKYEFPIVPIDFDILFDLENNNKIVIEPVKLTEELFLISGFEKIKDEPSPYDDGEFTLVSKRFTVYKMNIFTYNSIHGWWINGKHFPKMNLKYIHKFQNLYFTLTDEELIITL
jgi:hypothetical protein